MSLSGIALLHDDDDDDDDGYSRQRNFGASPIGSTFIIYATGVTNVYGSGGG